MCGSCLVQHWIANQHICSIATPYPDVRISNFRLAKLKRSLVHCKEWRSVDNNTSRNTFLGTTSIFLLHPYYFRPCIPLFRFNGGFFGFLLLPNC